MSIAIQPTTTPPPKLLTADEFFMLPDPKEGTKQELVNGMVVNVDHSFVSNGKVVRMPSPGIRHGEVQGNVLFAIKSFLKQHRIGRVVTESGMLVANGVRGPDVSYYSAERLPLDQEVIAYHDQPADLCVEVLSPSDTRQELLLKANEYLRNGVRMVWLIDPDTQTVLVVTPQQTRELQATDQLLGDDILPGFACLVRELFA